MSEIELTLKEYFGVSKFRNNQRDAIEAFIQERNTIALLPTGAGKSLCYQLPAIIKPGLMIVVVPLIALMDDQLQEWRCLNIPLEAAALHCHLSLSQRAEVIKKIEFKKLKILFISPEGLQNQALLEIINKNEIAGLVIDEAHCLLQWGLSFRGAYLKLKEIYQSLGHPPLMILSATIRYNEWLWIKDYFEFSNPKIIIGSMERENLKLKFALSTNRLMHLQRFLEQHKKQTGLVYVRTRREVDELSKNLRMSGYESYGYHAGMNKGDRKIVHQCFRRADQILVVATMAFGMGVNRSDVRFVYHYGLPTSLTHYAQEAGRAGRDGKLARLMIVVGWRELLETRWNHDHLGLLFFLVLGRWRASYLCSIFEHRPFISFRKLRDWVESRFDEFWKRIF
jgi:ATP-dependent DNA helicase RecQ